MVHLGAVAKKLSQTLFLASHRRFGVLFSARSKSLNLN